MQPARLARTRRIFIDSSVLIAASLSSRGAARDLLLAALSGDFEVRVSSLVLDETERNLTRKAPHSLSAFREFRDMLFSDEVIDPAPELVSRVEKEVEAKDAPIVGAAIAAAADFLATYDQKHLLSQSERIASLFGLSLATPDSILATSR
jgi:predicted nucleic acid-binding protein